MPDFYREVTRLLRTNQFVRAPGRKGSHEKWENAVLRRKVVVPRHMKSRHTANAILKSAGINKKL